MRTSRRTLRRALFALAIISIAGLVLVYPPLRVTSLLWPHWQITIWHALILFLAPMSIRGLHQYRAGFMVRVLSSLIMAWLGICFIMLSLLLPAELVLLLGWVEPQLTGRIVLALTIVLTLYALLNAQRLHVRTVDIPAPPHLQGRRLIQISDIHLGSRQPGFLRRIVKRVNHLDADYVVITGDLIDMHGITFEDLAPLAQLQSPVMYCIGNHERYVDLEQICERLRGHGVQVLRNEAITTNEFQFIGIDDAERKDQVSRQLTALAPARDTYRILLYHRPDDAAAAAAWGADLMLTGHTHRGQIFPFNLLVKRVFPEYYQLYRHQDMHLYVSPGTGTWGPPMRLGSKCEISCFQLL